MPASKNNRLALNDAVLLEEYCRQMLEAEPTKENLAYFAGKFRGILIKFLAHGPNGTLVPRDINYTGRRQRAEASTFTRPAAFTKFNAPAGPKEL